MSTREGLNKGRLLPTSVNVNIVFSPVCKVPFTFTVYEPAMSEVVTSTAPVVGSIPMLSFVFTYGVVPSDLKPEYVNIGVSGPQTIVAVNGFIGIEEAVPGKNVNLEEA